MIRASPFGAVPRGLRPFPRTLQTTKRCFLSPRQASSRPVERFNVNNLSRARSEYERDRTYFLAAGALAGIIGIAFTGTKLYRAVTSEDKTKRRAGEPQPGSLRLDANVPTEQFTTEAGSKRKVVLHDEQGNEIVPTGNKTVPEFPRTLELMPTERPESSSPTQPIAATVLDHAGVEYTLVGLGLRSVTFIGIQVYVVGYYIATSDIAKLQQFLVKKIDPLATTLVPSERDSLRRSLMDPKEGEEIWATILRDFKCRSAFRIVPVRDTDFPHLRDGFVRAIQARSNADAQAFGDDAFGEAMKAFRGIFNRGKAPKQKEMILTRDDKGALDVLYDDGKTGRQTIGRVEDERLSRLLWLNYLAGSKVASEEARKNITDGVMEFVERPVGTVATQVL